MWESDEVVINGMKQKSNQAFKVFYDRYIQYVYKIVIAIVKDHNDALDLCQELFLEYFQKAHTYNPDRGSVRAWIAIRARSRSVDFVRKQAKEAYYEPIEEVELKTVTTPLDEVEKRDQEKRVMDSLLKLPENQRDAIVYNYFHFMSHKQISERLDRPIGSVKSMIRYGINNLRKLYFEENGIEKRGDSDEKYSSNRRANH
ncbi:RNA polymerase sigma factor [Bacillaceae bacterium W0354]